MQITKDNATCSICGKSYYMCMSCKDQQMLSPWKIHTDTSEHYKVFQILHGLSIGIYTEQEAKEKLNNVNLSDKDSFLPNIKNRINKILNTSNVNKNNIKKEEVKEDKRVDDVKDEQKDKKPVVNKFFNNKK